MVNKMIRKSVKKLMIDADYDRPFGVADLAAKIGISRTNLSMCLSGYRSTDAAIKHLEKARDLLLAEIGSK